MTRSKTMSSTKVLRISVLTTSVFSLLFITIVYDVYTRYTLLILRNPEEDCQNEDSTCIDLLTDGRYISANGTETWQPYHCTMHYYKVQEAQECMRRKPFDGRNNIFSFVGDSRMRDLFRAFNQAVGFEGNVKKMHTNSVFKDHVNGIVSYFVWRPNTTTRMYDKLDLYADWLPEIKPTLVVVGAGLWSILQNNASKTAYKQYKNDLIAMTTVLKKLLKQGTLTLWRIQYPVKYEKMQEWGKVVTNDEIDKYNKIAEIILRKVVPRWWSSRYTAGKHMYDYGDGIHCGRKPSDVDAQILLNLYCNHKMKPKNTSCCLRKFNPYSML